MNLIVKDTSIKWFGCIFITLLNKTIMLQFTPSLQLFSMPNLNFYIVLNKGPLSLDSDSLFKSEDIPILDLLSNRSLYLRLTSTSKFLPR